MNGKLRLASLFLIIEVVLLGYLTLHFYPLTYGAEAGKSICNINATFNCDAVALSPYAALFGIPIAAWGAVTSLVIIVFLFLGSFDFVDDAKQALRYALYLSTFSLVVVAIMATISATLMGSYCVVCLGSYACTLLAFAFIFAGVGPSSYRHLGSDLKDLFGASKFALGYLIAVPIIAVIIHLGMLQLFGVQNVKAVVASSLSDWQANPYVKFGDDASLTRGPSRTQAVMTLIEFADFRCPHCGHAFPALEDFALAHPNVRFEFFNFPLDGQCNSVMQRGDGISCRLAKAVHCANDQHQGWKLHHYIYQHQRPFQQSQSVYEVDHLLKQATSSWSLNWSKLKSCMESEQTQQQIEKQAKIGQMAQVEGTPTLFANGRMLPGGQMLPVLNAALHESELHKQH